MFKIRLKKYKSENKKNNIQFKFEYTSIIYHFFSETISVYQVSYDISNEKIRKREIRGCIAGSKVTKCSNLFLITDHESGIIEEDGYTIQVLPVGKWLIR